MGTSSYEGEIQAAFFGPDTARFLKSMCAELLFVNWIIDIETRIRIDNSIVVKHVHPINSVKGAKNEWLSRE